MKDQSAYQQTHHMAALDAGSVPEMEEVPEARVFIKKKGGGDDVTMQRKRAAPKKKKIEEEEEDEDEGRGSRWSFFGWLGILILILRVVIGLIPQTSQTPLGSPEKPASHGVSKLTNACNPPQPQQHVPTQSNATGSRPATDDPREVFDPSSVMDGEEPEDDDPQPWPVTPSLQYNAYHPTPNNAYSQSGLLY